MNNILVKTSGKRVLYFYGKKGLYMKDLLRSNSNPKIIFNASEGDFDVIEVDNGEIGIICQDNEGSIVFLRETKDGYLKTTLLKNKSKAVYNKHFTLHSHGGWLSSIYIIDYDGKKILSHQIVDSENTSPFAVDEIKGTTYYSFGDSAGNIILFYNREKEFGYRVYRWGEKEWKDYVFLCEGELKTVSPGREGKFYILYSDGERDQCIVLLKNHLEIRVSGKAEMGKSCENAVMFFEDEFLWVIKEDREKLYGTKYNGEFERINGPLYFGNDSYKKKFRIKTGEKKYVISECYGYETNQIPKLIVYKNLYNTEEVLRETVRDQNEEIMDFAGISVKKETREQIELNKLRLKITDLQKRISKLENIINNR